MRLMMNRTQFQTSLTGLDVLHCRLTPRAGLFPQEVLEWPEGP